MKKNILYAMLAVGLMASCSKDSYVDAPDSDGNSDPDRALIMLSAAAPPVVSVGGSTRSVGSVGADGSGVTSNTWNEQILTMFAFPKDIGTEKTVIVNAGDISTKCPFFEKLAKAAKGGDSGKITWTDVNNNVAYFPRNGAFDFFGYHSDGAVIGAPTYTTVAGENVYAANFTIDGSQDLMYAKAVLTGAQKTKLGAEANKAFSSYTARRDIQPEMTFNHLLTRLTFTLIASKKEGSAVVSPGADEVYVRSVKVYSKTTGQFVVISNNKTADPLVWNSVARENYPFLFLKERKVDGNMQALNAGQTNEVGLYATNGDGSYKFNDKTSIAGKEEQYLGKYPASLGGTSIGESLLVAPDSEYIIEVEVMQYYNGDKKLIAPPAQSKDWYKDNVDQRYYKFTRTIKASDVVPATGGKITTFGASSSYNVSIAIYGLQDVIITANLGKWVNGGNVNWTPEDEDFLNNNK